MTSDSRIGTVRIAVDGSWDVEDLRSLATALSESYGLFYPLVASDEAVAARLHDLLRKQFWSGDIDTRNIGLHLYNSIPADDRLKLKSFHYSSPGAAEFSGIMVGLLLLSRVARSWITTGDAFFSLWEKIDKFFEKKKTLRRPAKTTMLDDDIVVSSDEARVLVFELGEKLGFDAISCERLIDVIGNPISTLKYLVMAGNEGRRLSDLQTKGLLTLPSTSEAITIAPQRKAPRRTGQGIVVESVGRRKKK